MSLESLFCAPFEPDQVEFLITQQRQFRAQHIWDTLPGNRGRLTGVAPDRWGLLDTYLTALSALLKGAPARGRDHIGHWAPSFYVYYLLSEQSSAAAAEQAASNLFAMMLRERLDDGSSPLAGLEFVLRTDRTGSIPVFSEDARVRLPGLASPGASWRFHCSERSATVAPAGGEGPPISVPLPLDEASGAQRVPFERVQGWDIPVLDDSWAAILRAGEATAHSMAAQSAGEDDRSRLPLRDTLGETFHTLAELWPEVAPWVRLFVPAVVEVPPPADPRVRFSGGLMPGAPIYMSRVADPYRHTEDLVHELQHARLLFLSPVTRYFASFREGNALFISPYRTDPRPLCGLHLGIHAFIAVTELRLRALGAGKQDDVLLKDLLRVHRMNVFSHRTIKAHERFSPEGRRLFDEISRVLWEQHRAIEPALAGRFGAEVEQSLEEHRARVEASGAGLVNSDVSFGPATADELAPSGQPEGALLAEVTP